MTSIDRVSARGLSFIKRWEGFRADAYGDVTGVRTVGYGTTSAIISPLPDHVTIAEASRLLELALEKVVYPAMATVGPWTHQERFDAVADAVYNLGAGVLERGRSLGDALRASTRQVRVPEALMLYDHAGGQVVPGLFARRSAEAVLWERGEY